MGFANIIDKKKRGFLAFKDNLMNPIWWSFLGSPCPVKQLPCEKLKKYCVCVLNVAFHSMPLPIALELSKGVVAKYDALAQAAHLDWQTIEALDEKQLAKR